MASESNKILRVAVRHVLSRRAAALLGAGLAIGSARAAELPVPCAGGSCGVPGFVTSGQATAVASGAVLNVNQQSNSAILNWQSFNISRDATVNFNQPNAAAVAINRIHDATRPSTIAGQLNANGQVYLLNRNGIIFDNGAQVNVGGLVASSLSMTQAAIERGIAGAVDASSAAFERDTGLTGSIRVESGASINAPGGQVMLFAPDVANRGTIRTPDGQTILGGGESVFLAASTDQDLRGLYVEVRGQGRVTNGDAGNASAEAAQQVGRIIADRGNVTLVGSLVRQQGQVSATTSTRANGSVRLLARTVSEQRTPQADLLRTQDLADTGGTLEIGPRSATSVTLDATDTSQTVDVNAQPRSRVQMSGRLIEIGAASTVTATAGVIDVVATRVPDLDVTSATEDGSRIVVASDARLDVSGTSVELPMERNLLRVELRGSQLADSPAQRDGALRSEPVFVDVRESGTRADGTTWIGTPLADVSGDVSNIRRGLSERNLSGGTINLHSQGAVVVGAGAQLNVSGGFIDWQSGYINTSQLLGVDGRIYDIADADRERSYLSIANGYSLTDQRWGTTNTYYLQGVGQSGRFEAGYLEGRDAGNVTIIAPRAVVDGNIVGTTVVGQHQRREQTGSNLRATRFDLIPRAAQLAIGLNVTGEPPDLVSGEVEIGGSLHQPAGVHTLADAGVLLQNVTGTRVRSELLGPDGVGELRIFSNEGVRISSAQPLQLQDNGTIAVTAGRIDIQSSIRSTSGTLQFRAQDTAVFRGSTPETSHAINVAEGVTLDARGSWVNEDRTLTGNDAFAPLHVDGGSISLSVSDGPLNLGAASVFDVSGGALRRADGSIQAGAAGSITLAALSPLGDRPAVLTLGAELRGAALQRGGSLSIAAPSICIGNGGCAEDPVPLAIDVDALVAGGFESLSLATNLGDLTLASGTTLNLQQSNLELLDTHRNAVSGTAFDTLVRSARLPDEARRPISLSLRAGYRALAPQVGSGHLRLEAGTAIVADPLARIALATDSSALLAGLIRAPGGQVSLTVDNTNSRGYDATQGVLMGDSAVIDVSGIPRYINDPGGRLLGDVVDGGSVTLDLQRGFLLTADGSRIDASGTSAVLDLFTTGSVPVRTQVASGGGRITLSAAEAMQINGSLRAASGAPGEVEGGTLEVRLDAGRRRSDNTPNPAALPAGDRQIVVTASETPIVVAPGTALPASLQGQGSIPIQAIAGGGFDSVVLTARNVTRYSNDNNVPDTLGGYGMVLLEPGVHLNPAARLTIDSAAIGIVGNAGEASLSSSYVGLTRELGPNSGNAIDRAAPAAMAGHGTLTIEGNLIDLFGNVTLTGLESATLRSSGDLRGRGVLNPVARRYEGRLESTGTLHLEAQQIYPSTLADFTFAMTGGETDSIWVRSVGGERDPVLSAGGRLQLDAPTIDVAGTLRAPLGEIELNAQQLNVSSGGVLSTSLEGQTVPFGTTQGGLAWAYTLNNQVTRIFGPDGEPLPEQRVVLNAQSVNVAAGSTIDVGGGGDLLAYEFVPGPGGSRDVLASSVRPNQFAIVPGANPAFAPHDPNESAGVNLQAGDTVWLGSGSGVPEGVYTLLPARYALLPGAYLVEAVAGYRDIRAGESYATLAGGNIVAGRRGISGTSLFDSRTTGFRVRPGTDALQEARYDLSTANDFFTRSDEELASTGLPRDAGTVTLLATSSLALQGILRAATGTNGRGATLEISAPSLSIVNDGQAAGEGSLAVRAAQLSALGAQRLLIGGRRSRGPDGETITVQADAVTVEEGVRIASPEIVLAANDLLSVRAGAQIEATGASFSSDEELTLTAGASFLRASISNQVMVERSISGAGAGVLEIAAGAVLRAPGSVTVDVGTTAVTNGTFDIGSGSLALGADLIGLGRAPDAYTGVAVDSGSLGSIADGSLELRARSALDLFTGTNFVAREATLSTPVIRAGSADAEARFDVGQLTLIGGDTSAALPATGTATLNVTAERIDLAGGTLQLDGFATANISARNLIEASASGSLRTGGDLGLSAGLITASAATDYAFGVGRNLRFGVIEPSDIPPPSAAALGARLSFSGADVSGDARVSAAAGQIAIAATGAGGNVSLGSRTQLDVSGRTVRFDDVDVAASGGTIQLDSASGSISVAAGANLNVGAASATQAHAGSLQITAREGSVDIAGTLLGAAARRENGGSINVTANAFSFDQLRSGLTSGGFTGDWNLWLRGAGDLSLASSDTITARSVALAADQGAVRIGGTIDAGTPRGGHVVLAASGPVEIAGTILAAGTDANVRGGRVELLSGTGVALGQSARIDVSGSALTDPALQPGGLVSIRAPRAAFASVLDADTANDALALFGAIGGARSIVLEGFERYTLSDGQVTDTSTATQWFADAQAFSTGAATIAQALGIAGDARFSVRPGVELVADANDLNEQGTLELLADWNLYDWRFGAQSALPGVLTLRAAGDLLVNGSLSDGFTAADSYQLAEDAGESWSYRLAAGADLNGANPLATRRSTNLATATGSIVVGAGTPGTPALGGQQRVIRTGTGSVDIAAAADLVLTNEASLIYTAGASGPGVRIPEDPTVGGLGSRAYPVNGGDLSIAVGRDINAQASTQLYSDWLLRSGAPDAVLPTTTAWTVAFDYFEQGIAALGGGNVAVAAGRDIHDLSASTPSIGRQVGGVEPQQNAFQVVGGGDLNVRAGGSISGGQFFADRGIGRISAGDSVDISAQTGLAPLLALGDASLAVEARRSVDIAGFISPSLLIPVDPVFGPLTSGSTFFGNYTADSALSLLAIGAELHIGTALEALTARYPSVNSAENPAPFAVLPPTFTAAALSGSLTMQKGAPVTSMWPAPRGNLQLFAHEDINLEPLLMSDAALGAALPTPQNPQSEPVLIANILSRSVSARQLLNASTPVHADDPEPARIVALTGDIAMTAEGGALVLYVPKPLQLSAGRDVIGLNARLQHFGTANVSTISAGRDITYPLEREDGRLDSSLGEISIDGPGTLQLVSGRDVDLQTSGGVVSQGNLRNSALPAGGADISIMAGLAAREPDYATMIDRYLASSEAYDAVLLDYVEAAYRQEVGSTQQALSLFEQLSRSKQRPLLEAVLFSEIKAGGRAAAEAGAGNGDFTRAFTALEAFFPGANPDVDAGDTNPYAGDVRLFFSRVYTLDGGGINIMAPGGEINVGLAAPPLAFGILKEPSDLGLVVQSTGSINALSYRDYQVNESRTFAADGGSILVWSTRGDIDAGRGAKTAISAPPPVITVDPNGQVRVTFPAALSGSGIQTLATTAGRKPGDVDLFAPRGVVNAGDAGIVAGNLTIAATAVLGADNIQVSGVAVGVPVETSGLGVSLAGASAVASSASSAATALVESGSTESGEQVSLAQAALSWLEVFVVGLGEEGCRPDDLECLKRQQ